MSIVAAFGAAPSNLTVPLTVAAVAGSIGVAGAEVAAGLVAGCSSGASFLLQPASKRSEHIAASAKFVIQIVFFILFLFLFRCLQDNTLKKPSSTLKLANANLFLRSMTCTISDLH